MGCFPFANSRFQMGVTVMGFAEDFGRSHLTGSHFFGCSKVQSTFSPPSGPNKDETPTFQDSTNYIPVVHTNVVMQSSYTKVFRYS